MGQRYPVKNKRGINAVSGVVGTMLLLGMAVSLFSIVYISVLSIPSSQSTPSANIVCKMDGNRIILEHYGGDALALDTKLLISVGTTLEETTVGDISSSLSWDSNNDGQWGMGEKLVYSEDGLFLEGKQVEINVVDVGSNSLVMMGTLQGGLSSTPSLGTYVNVINPYNQTNSPLTVDVIGSSGLDNVTLWYRYSTDKESWGSYSIFDIPDTMSPWRWSFEFPDGKGYYEFYSVGMYNSDGENDPANADAMCFYNQAPEISDPYPVSESTDIPVFPTLHITVSDTDGDSIYITWYSNSSGSWRGFGTNTSVPDGSYQLTNNNFSINGKTYYWYIAVNDDFNIINSPIYCFTTEELSSWTTLTYDNFESGWSNYSDGGNNCALYTGGIYAYQGSNAANIQDNRGDDSSFSHTNGIDVNTLGYTSITVDFWFRAESMEDNEDFWVRYYDGSDWNTIADYDSGDEFVNGQFYHGILWINETSYTFPSNMKIRFQCDAGSKHDDIYIDQIYVNATG